MTDEIEWAEPPAHALRPGQMPGRYVPIALALKDNPGAWAKVPHQATNADSLKTFAGALRRGKTKGFELDEAHGKFVTAIDGMDLYVRWEAKEPTGYDTPAPVEDDDTEESGNGQRGGGRGPGRPSATHKKRGDACGKCGLPWPCPEAPPED